MIVDEAEVSSVVDAFVTERLVIVVVASDTVPVAVRLVKIGLVDTLIVEVEEKTILVPAVK